MRKVLKIQVIFLEFSPTFLFKPNFFIQQDVLVKFNSAEKRRELMLGKMYYTIGERLFVQKLLYVLFEETKKIDDILL